MEERVVVVPHHLPPLSPLASSPDPRSGFDSASRTFHSLRPYIPLPPPDRPFSFAAYAFSLLPSPLPSHPAIVNAVTGDAISFADFISQVRSLSAALRSEVGLAKGHVVFILAPPLIDIPALYLAILSIGAVISAANPASTLAELDRLVSLSDPHIAFAASHDADKLPSHVATVLLDSPSFRSFLDADAGDLVEEEEVEQSDVAVIQYSSGTTGMVKAAALSHRNFIAMVAGFHSLRLPAGGAEVTLLGAPLFHSMGFFFLMKGLALGETTVVMGGRGGVKEMIQAAERYRATAMTASPPVVVAMARSPESVGLKTLEYVTCGGAPLPEAAAMRFMRRFPHVQIRQYVKKMLGTLPYTCQSQSPSPYFDLSLFRYDEKLISSTDRHRHSTDHPIKFISRRQPNVPKFRIKTGLDTGGADNRVKRSSFLFHPYLPLVLSIQQTYMQPTVVNIHLRL